MTQRAPISAMAVLKHCDKPRTVAEIAAKLGRPGSSVHRMLMHLQANGQAKKEGTHDGASLWVATESGATSAAAKRVDPRTHLKGGARDLLELLASEPGLSAAEAARRLKRNQSNVNTVAKRLEAKGLVELGARTKAGMPMNVTARGLAEIGGGR